MPPKIEYQEVSDEIQQFYKAKNNKADLTPYDALRIANLWSREFKLRTQLEKEKRKTND